jgi:hypothetical protein
MVAAVRRGQSQRAVARAFRVSLDTVQRWVARAGEQPLERVEWSNRSTRPHQTRRVAPAIEAWVVALRRELAESALGEGGAGAIHRELVRRWADERPEGVAADRPVPSVRTVGRILLRRGVLDGRARVRRRPPPPGWYLPRVAAGEAELELVDVVEGLVIKGGPQVEVLTALSLHGGLAEAWPDTAISARRVVAALVAHWQAVGLPAYAQFDNDTRFQGPHQHPDVIGRVTRLCLSLGVVPVFVPAHETGFQAAIESFNGRWQAKVWSRFAHESLAALQRQSARYIAASRCRSAVRLERAPPRRPFPTGWRLDLQAHPQGQLIFLRRTSEAGIVSLLGRAFLVDPTWPHRLVRCEVDLEAGCIRFYALRRRAPQEHRFLSEQPYVLPRRRFRD